MKKFQKGFTLIELLIVIAVLGILAAGVLATIDPFEQFKKARDTNTRNTMVELYNSFIRFNANHGNWPWETTAGGNGTAPNMATLSSITGSLISTIVNDGELKSGFASNIDATVLSSSFVTYLTSPSQTVAVCFLPQSKTIKKDSNTKYNSAGGEDATCPGTGTSNTCYWCAK
jgi:prepilin-type N-terminal cleavage/methylation domain-containing protein